MLRVLMQASMEAESEDVKDLLLSDCVGLLYGGSSWSELTELAAPGHAGYKLEIIQ